jgi:predicted ATP-grasp superfamily ATP-dependent carboligase
MEKSHSEIYQIPNLQTPSLLVGWQTQDIGKLGTRVIDFLNNKLGGQEIARIKPKDFFSFGGVKIENDVARISEGRFFACEKNNLLLFKSDEPEDEWYRFLDSVLDVAQYSFKIKDLYTVNGNPSLTPHTLPRRILTVFNRTEFGRDIERYGFLGMYYEGPPAMSSFLLWAARRRNILGASIWVDIPFYLAPLNDFLAQKRVLEFFNQRFNLKIDLKELDIEIREQNEKIARLREQDSEINRCLNLLERGIGLGEEEQLKLARQIYEFLEM